MAFDEDVALFRKARALDLEASALRASQGKWVDQDDGTLSAEVTTDYDDDATVDDVYVVLSLDIPAKDGAGEYHSGIGMSVDDAKSFARWILGIPS